MALFASRKGPADDPCSSKRSESRVKTSRTLKIAMGAPRSRERGYRGWIPLPGSQRLSLDDQFLRGGLCLISDLGEPSNDSRPVKVLFRERGHDQMPARACLTSKVDLIVATFIEHFADIIEQPHQVLRGYPSRRGIPVNRTGCDLDVQEVPRG